MKTIQSISFRGNYSFLKVETKKNCYKYVVQGILSHLSHAPKQFSIPINKLPYGENNISHHGVIGKLPIFDGYVRSRQGRPHGQSTSIQFF